MMALNQVSWLERHNCEKPIKRKSWIVSATGTVWVSSLFEFDALSRNELEGRNSFRISGNHMAIARPTGMAKRPAGK
jgi:hypothetical protein